jgi:hypothetical protein
MVARQGGITEATWNTQTDGAPTGGGAPSAKRRLKEFDGADSLKLRRPGPPNDPKRMKRD